MDKNDETGKTNDSSSNNQWSDLILGLIDRLTGKEAIVEYSFEDFMIDIPKAVGPDGKTLGGVKWTINGKITIKAETHKSA